MKKPINYVPTEGCPFCTQGYNMVPCSHCGGLGGCSNLVCVDGEVAVACECNTTPYMEDHGWTIEEAAERLGWLEKEQL